MNETRPQEASFEQLVVGGWNQRAVTAALRVCQAPEDADNPLVICGVAGSGKTHLLRAIADRTRELHPERWVRYTTASEMAERPEGAEQDLDSAPGLLLVDDFQQFAGKVLLQQRMSRWLDELPRQGVQFVVASGTLPSEIPALDAELSDQLAAGAVVEIAPLDVEARRQLVRNWADERNLRLSLPLLEAMARLPLDSIARLSTAMERLAALLASERKEPEPTELAERLGVEAPRIAPPSGEFGDFLADISSAVAAAVEISPWRRVLTQAAARWEQEGIRTRRLQAALEAEAAPDVEALLSNFERDVARLRELERQVGEHAPDATLFRDPDRLPEAETLFEAVAGRSRGDAQASATADQEQSVEDPWFLDRERFAWEWDALEDRLLEEPD